MKRLILFAFLAVLTATTFAADVPRKIDFTQALTGNDGKPLVDTTDPKNPIPLTLGYYASAALGVTLPSDKGISRGQATRLGVLAEKTRNCKSCSVTGAESELILSRIFEAGFPHYIYSQCEKILDPTAYAKALE
jgi:hypothetical protein